MSVYDTDWAAAHFYYRDALEHFWTGVASLQAALEHEPNEETETRAGDALCEISTAASNLEIAAHEEIK